MAGESTFDLTTPVRPGLTVFNGAAKIDDDEDPPDLETMPNANEYNALCKLMASLGKICPLAILCIAGSTHAISSFVAPGNNVIASNFTVTNPATGHFVIAIAANVLPPLGVNPVAVLNMSDGTTGQIAAYLSGGDVHVRTANASGTATNLDFTVHIF